MRKSKYLKKSKEGYLVKYPYRKKTFKFCKVKYELRDYKQVNCIDIKFKKYDVLGKVYGHTIDVSELLYYLEKRKKLKCGRLVLFDFDKKNNLLGIRIINEVVQDES